MVGNVTYVVSSIFLNCFRLVRIFWSCENVPRPLWLTTLDGSLLVNGKQQRRRILNLDTRCRG